MPDSLQRDTLKHSRRDFLATSAAVVVGLTQVGPAASRLLAQELPTADKVVAGKNAKLIVYNAKVGEIETPLELLRSHSITPKELLFVRNNQLLPGVMTTHISEPGTWDIELLGLVNAPAQVTVAELLKLESHEHEMVLQCSGNGRAKFSKAAKVDGAPWGHGAMGNVRFKGVAIADLLEQLKLTIKPDAKFLTAEGRDAPDKAGAPDFEHSLPLGDVLERSILATHMNGEPLPLVHGGPVRLVTPGYYGTMQVKWVSKLRFEAAESSNYHHMPRYRTPLKPIAAGGKFVPTFENSEPNWDMKIKSVIFSPLEGEKISNGKEVIVSGVAWNDGTAKISSVEVSTDDGQTWTRADVKMPASRHAWHPWRATLTLADGTYSVRSRAIDALGRTQPFDGSIAWNPAGYAWNGVDEVKFVVS